MKDITSIVEFIQAVEIEHKTPLSEEQVKEVFAMLVEKIGKLQGGREFSVKSKLNGLLGENPSEKKSTKQLASIEINKKKKHWK